MEIYEKVRWLRTNTPGVSNTIIRQWIDMDESAFNKRMSNNPAERTNFSRDQVRILAEKFGVSQDWLNNPATTCPPPKMQDAYPVILRDEIDRLADLVAQRLIERMGTAISRQVRPEPDADETSEQYQAGRPAARRAAAKARQAVPAPFSGPR